jgi:hypothetical protein
MMIRKPLAHGSLPFSAERSIGDKQTKTNIERIRRLDEPERSSLHAARQYG